MNVIYFSDEVEFESLVVKVQSAALLTIQRLYQALKNRPVQELGENEFEEVNLL